mgnify:FL=1
MNKIDVKFKNCNGINKLKHTFNFNNNNSTLIYASNGTMKTSFAKTFLFLSEGKEPINEFTKKDPEHNVKIYNENNEFDLLKSEDFKNNILVIQSFDDEYNFDNISSLMVNDKSKKEYETLISEILLKRKELFKKIKKISKISVPKNQNQEDFIEKKILQDFSCENKSFLELMIDVEKNLSKNNNVDVLKLKYNNLFSEKVIKILDNEELVQNINGYVNALNALLKSSKIYDKDNFDNVNAENLYKNIKTNNLFKAGHSIKFGGVNEEVKSIDELKSLLDKQIEDIMSDENIKTKFDLINKQLTGNNDIKNLRSYLLDNPLFAVRLKKENRFNLRKEFWLSILNNERDLYNDLIVLYKNNKNKINKIKTSVEKERTDWEEVVDLFNQRFKIPFLLEIENKKDIILNDELPNIVFNLKPDKEYLNNEEVSSVNFETLKTFYSAGQKRALYLLNILYKIELLKKTGRDVLLIFDDIADSFDYENKYAIIEYLYDLSHSSNFKSIILTHNYDFFRTVKSRLSLSKSSFFAVKNEFDIKLIKPNLENKDNILFKLKSDIETEHNAKKAFLSIIPFLRNLSELAGNKDDKNLLTSILHFKEDGEKLKVKDLEPNYEKCDMPVINPEDTIYNLIYNEAIQIKTDNDMNGILLENKIVLSMAIRLHAEKFMLDSLNNTNEIKRNQTRTLYEIFKEEFSTENDEKNREILKQVCIMTPENIHLNSFMYEPILDMDIEYLIKLFDNVKNLSKILF